MCFTYIFDLFLVILNISICCMLVADVLHVSCISDEEKWLTRNAI